MWHSSLLRSILSVGESHYSGASVHQKVLDQTSNVILDPNSHLPPKETSPGVHVRALCSGINALSHSAGSQKESSLCREQKGIPSSFPSLSLCLGWHRLAFPNEGLTTHMPALVPLWLNALCTEGTAERLMGNLHSVKSSRVTWSNLFQKWRNVLPVGKHSPSATHAQAKRQRSYCILFPNPQC